MKNEPTLKEWNWCELMLVQALLGAISKNVRRIFLKSMEDTWRLEVMLEEPSEEDEEEMEDVAFYFENYLQDIRDELSDAALKEMIVKCFASKKNLANWNTGLGENCRTIFIRKEEDDDAKKLPYTLPYEALDVRQIDDCFLVVYDPDKLSKTTSSRNWENVELLDKEGKRLWTVNGVEDWPYWDADADCFSWAMNCINDEYWSLISSEGHKFKLDIKTGHVTYISKFC